MITRSPSYTQGFAHHAGESEHPELWHGLRAAWVPELGQTGGTLHDVVRSNNAVFSGVKDIAADWTVTQYGRAISYDGAAGDQCDANGAFPLDDITRPWTMLCGWTATALQNFSGMLELYGSGTERVAIGINANNTKVVTSGETPNDGNIALSTGTFYVQAVGWDGSDFHSWLDGVHDYQVTPTGADWQNANTVNIGTAGSVEWQGDVYAAYIFDRLLTASEHRAFARDLLAPLRLRRRVFKAPAAPAGDAIPMAMDHYRRRRAG